MPPEDQLDDGNLFLPLPMDLPGDWLASDDPGTRAQFSSNGMGDATAPPKNGYF